jgi:hypothetical protein
MKYIFIVVSLVFSVYSVIAQQFKVDTLQYNGPTYSLINIAILGDGYQENELDTFISDARKMWNALFNEKPYSNYRNFFNIVAISVPSNESGAGINPAYLVDNYFGSTFGYAGIERLLVPTHRNRITNVLAHNFPDYDQVIMLVNSSKYGGSGGFVATASTHRSSSEIAIHELGHSFAGLADEYWAGAQYAREAINMTREIDLELLKWKNWFGDFGVGLYPFNEAPEWHRPHQNCKMRFLGSPFCPVCTEGKVERIHALAPPLLSWFPAYKELIMPNSQVTFQLELLKPEPNTLQINWELNGFPLNIEVDSVIIDRAILTEGDNFLSAAVLDTTLLSRHNTQSTIRLSVVTWQIKNSTTSIENISSASIGFRYNLYPNPVSETLNINVEGTQHEIIYIEIFDLNGRLQLSHKLTTGDVNKVSLDGLATGSYLIRFYTNNKYVASGKFIKVF